MAATSVKSTQEIQQQTLDEVNSAVRVNLVAGTITGADGAILDGVLSSIKATVLDLTSSNPLTAAIVDGTGAQITSFGGGTQYNDGAARGSATGTLALGDDGTNLQSLACSSAGRLSVEINSSALPSGAATAAAQLPNSHDVTVDNASGASAVNVQDGGNVISVDDGAGSLTVDNAQLSVVGTGTEATALRVTIATDSTGVLSVDDNGSSLTVDGTITANLAAGTNNIGDVDVLTLPALASGTNNIGDVDVLTIAAGDNNIGNVDIVTLPNVTLSAGTNTNEVVGDAAHDAAIAGNPVRIAGRALTADYTAVAAGDTADLITTLTGKIVNYPFANPNQSWSYAAASGGIVNTTGVTIKAAGGAGVRLYLTDLHVINGHATVSTDVQIRDGASGTVLWRGFGQAAGGGISVHFSTPLRGTANTLLEVACGTTGSAVYVNAAGFSAAE